MLAGQNQEISLRTKAETWKQTLLSPQVLLLLLAWFFLCWLHWNNDGLWYGDAPRHAANGLFWKDYLLNLSLNPKNYALSYHARYPVIAPTTYPPVFYLVEAFFFGTLKPSPYIAKTLVLGFTLMAALYTTIWSRKWIAKEAGWAGILLVLLPGIVRWSHAIMLNVPALALSIGALYHFRRWLESPPASPAWRQLYIGAALAVLSMLTYVTSCMLILIVGMWLLMKRRWILLWNYRTLVVFIVSALALLPWILLVVMFESNRIETATGGLSKSTSYWLWSILYYPKRMPELFGTHILLIASFGIIGGIFSKRWRHETIILLIIAGVCYAFFTYIPSKESRYILLLSMPISCFCIIAILSITEWITIVAKQQHRPIIIATTITILLLIGIQTWLASRVLVPSVEGINKIVSFIEEVAPDEPVFYCGIEYANFTFHIQAGDPDYRRRVVLSRKLLYAESTWDKIHEFISSPEDAVEVLQKRGGCQWLVIARRVDTPPSKASIYLREAVKGPEFELARSFPIKHLTGNGWQKSMVDVYKFLVPIEKIDVIDMPLFSLGENVRMQIKPIQR
jgi:4-amino-4-deoxy-L-arabinose transferase-like glycosyltransferase